MWKFGQRSTVFLASGLLALLAGLGQAPAHAATSGGINDWNCTPSSAHPEPVVMVHGLGGSGETHWSYMAPQLRDAGYCVFYLTYGVTHYGIGGFASMRDSAAELGDFVDEVLHATAAEKVSIVGHSEGTTVPAYYLKYLGGAAKVENVVGFGSNYRGTTLYGLTTLGSLLGFGYLLTAGGCPACAEFFPDSEFMADLNSGGTPVVPGPTYTSIITKYDAVVVPYTSGEISGPNARTIVLQDVCRWDYTGHVGLAFNPNVLQMVENALDPANAKPVQCVPYFAPF